MINPRVSAGETDHGEETSDGPTSTWHLPKHPTYLTSELKIPQV